MSATDETLQSGGSETSVKILNFLIFVSLVCMVGSFAVVGYFARLDAEYQSRAAAVRVLSQQIAKNASEAANGKTDAFSFLQTAQKEMQSNIDILTGGRAQTSTSFPEVLQDFGLPATKDNGPAAEKALGKVIRPWKEMSKDVDVVLANRKEVLVVNTIAGTFRVTIPQIQTKVNELSKQLVAANAPRSQVVALGEMLMLAERITHNISQMLAGGLGTMTARERFVESTDEFGDLLNSLKNGSGSIARVTEPRARRTLAELSTIFDKVSESVTEIEKRSPDLFEVRDAADNIFITSEQMLATSRFLIDIYEGLSDNRLWKEWFGFAFGLAVIVLIFFRGLAARRVDVIRLEQTRRQKALADEETTRNQEAIIELLDEIQELQDGDLTVQASVGEAFTGAIADAFNSAIESLRSLVLTINETSVQVSSAAQQTQATAMHLAEASDHQAHQITAASAAINEMAVSIDQVSNNASDSSKVAQKSVELASKGADTVRRTIDAMDQIREQIQETSKRIKRLGESSQEIGNIVELINDIADQTNILALNASIQAAMAGEAGRGFAVVADEVQRLAERSSNATKQIEALVKTIQTDTNEAVISMEQSTAGVVNGARLAEEAGDALHEIESVSTNLAGLIQSISETARQQANAAANISDTMNVIQEITSQTSAGTNETATSIGNLADLANELRNSVAGFKLPE